MNKAKILYVSQEIQPFCPETLISRISRQLPQGAHEKDKEIRVFMPRYGKINERRHQLHEVIRLSGMNLIINDTDHPLIIKVASIPTARMQVYFIDNEEYFKRKFYTEDDEGGLFEDSDERAMFFVRGVLETVKKLGWVPDVIHTHGWMASLLPAYVKNNFANDPHFANAKMVHSIYEDCFDGDLDGDLAKKLKMDGIDAESADMVASATCANLNRLATKYADGIIVNGEGINPELKAYAEKQNAVLVESMNEDNIVAEATTLYDTILEGNPELVEE